MGDLHSSVLASNYYLTVELHGADFHGVVAFVKSPGDIRGSIVHYTPPFQTRQAAMHAAIAWLAANPDACEV